MSIMQNEVNGYLRTECEESGRPLNIRDKNVKEAHNGVWHIPARQYAVDIHGRTKTARQPK